jgi:hypothetical protein
MPASKSLKRKKKGLNWKALLLFAVFCSGSNEWSQQERDRDRGGRPSEKKKFGSIRLLAFILDGQLFA